MKGIISNHSALTAYQRQTAVDPVGVPRSPGERESATSSTTVKAVRVSISAEARALAAGEVGAGDTAFDQAKVDRLREALRSGTLKFDSSLVAQRMIDQAE
jgi:flagellar biosynthesis anti-sigma factor FlgM